MAEASESPKSSQDNSVSSTESNGETITNLESKNSNTGNIAIQLSSPRTSISRRFSFRDSLLQDSPGKSATNRTFVLNPPKLSNPFDNKVSDVDKKEEDASKKELTPAPEAVAFVPLRGEPATPSSKTAVQPFSQSSSPALGFVFGQNIHEKVEAAASGEVSNPVTEPVGAAQEPVEPKTNGATSEMLFSSSVKKDEKNDKNTDNAGKTLSEAAREYEEARAVKRKFEEVQVVTGEEEEYNVLQMNCKLFSWSEYSWVEMGRVTLRVNDVPMTNPPQHRLIMRTIGSLRIVLNTKIWAGMSVDKASSKSLRITAMDCHGVVKVFLILSSPKDIDQLERCLHWRVHNLKKLEEAPTKKLKEEEAS